jgi:hypothetical protein
MLPALKKFEHKSQKPLPRKQFLARLWLHFIIAAGVTFVALALGMAGYHVFEGFSWIDSFLNASMILGGMGEVDALKTDSGKLFAGCYALFSGLWVVTSMALLLAPVFHRIMHKLHCDTRQ